MSRGLVIVGAGSMGREAYAYASELIAAGRAQGYDRVSGFIDLGDTPGTYLSRFSLEYDFIDTLATHQHRDDFVYVTASGSVSEKRRAVEALPADARWANIIHLTACVAASARLGHGIVLAPFTFVGLDAELGDHVLLNAYASCGHDSRVGRYSILSPYAAITGNVVLEDEVLLGMHSSVIPGRRVGRRSSVSAGSAVLRDVPPGSLIAGNPAKGRVMYHVEDAPAPDARG